MAGRSASVWLKQHAWMLFQLTTLSLLIAITVFSARPVDRGSCLVTETRPTPTTNGRYALPPGEQTVCMAWQYPDGKPQP